MIAKELFDQFLLLGDLAQFSSPTLAGQINGDSNNKDESESSTTRYKRRMASLAESVHKIVQSGSPVINLSGRMLTDHELIKVVMPILEDEKLASSWIVLDLSWNALSPLCGKELAKSLNIISETKKVTIKGLQLSCNKLGDAGVKDLCRELSPSVLKSIEFLTLGFNRLGDDAACALGKYLLSRAPALRLLSLDCGTISDDGAKGLADGLLKQQQSRRPSSLETLSLSSNQIGDKGVEAIASALPGMPGIKELSLASNSFGDAGVIALSKALQRVPGETSTHRSLKKLNIASCPRTTEEGIKTLIPAIQQSDLEILDLTGNAFTLETAHTMRQIMTLKQSTWSKVMQSMLAAREVARIGKGSPISSIPKELIRKVGEFLPQFEEGEAVQHQEGEAPPANPVIVNVFLNVAMPESLFASPILAASQ